MLNTYVHKHNEFTCMTNIDERFYMPCFGRVFGREKCTTKIKKQINK